MTRPLFIVEGQRPSHQGGWLAVEDYKATCWAVIKVERFSRKRKTYHVRTVIARCETFALAKDLAGANTKSFEPLKTYVLGKRIIKDDKVPVRSNLR